MMKKFLFTMLLILFCFTQSTFAFNYISWQVQKGEGTYWYYVGIDTDDLTGVIDCYLKGPNMADYITADWDAGRTQWYSRVFYSTFSELKINGVGTWLVKIIYQDSSESIYTFTIGDTLEESYFPPVPTIIAPIEGASNIIAEDYNLSWDSNGADLVATMLAVEVGGDGFFYYNYDNTDVSWTTWQPGWLEIGEAFLGVSYMINHTPDMFISGPTLISGPSISWIKMAHVGSGAKNDFTVKFSLDFNEDDLINLEDISVIFSHWLEEK